MKKQILSLVVVSALAATLAPAAFAVEKTQAISGDLNVTNFFGEKTDAVELKDGDSYTFTFKNKSNGTNNWENYVLAVTGAIGGDYTGADQEIVVIRADNWGWGGGMSDFAAPDAADGNKLAFETDIDWNAFESDCQAGVDVEVTLSRDGNTATTDGGDAATTDGGDTTTTGDTANSTDTTAPTIDAGTANTTTGASAGLALAGAAVVVSKRK